MYDYPLMDFIFKVIYVHSIGQKMMEQLLINQWIIIAVYR